MRDIDVLTCNCGIAIVPDTGKRVVALWAYNIIADTCGRSGWIVNPTDTGLVAELILVSCWGASCDEHGMVFAAYESSANLGSVTLTAPRCINNKKNGIVLDGTGNKYD